MRHHFDGGPGGDESGHGNGSLSLQLLQHDTAVETAATGAPLGRLQSLYEVMNGIESDSVRIIFPCSSSTSTSSTVHGNSRRFKP